jgi:catechol 2,3-dioxygenase-like lactoylglutathione lyase family enzyme
MSQLNIVKVLHVGISVSDMEKSLDWYEKCLGFKKVPGRDDYVPPLGARIVFVEREDGFQLELFKYDNPKPLPKERLMPNDDLQTIGTKHVAFRIDDYDAVRERLLEHGTEIAHEPVMGNDKVMFIHDPDGVLIELIYTNP